MDKAERCYYNRISPTITEYCQEQLLYRLSPTTPTIAEYLKNKDSPHSQEQHVTEQTKKRVSDGIKVQNTVPAAAPPNKKQKQNMPGKTCDADSFAQLAMKPPLFKGCSRIASMPSCRNRRVRR